jgi:hypothetical protein
VGELARAPLVIPQRKVTTVRLLGKSIGQKETLTFEMGKQSLSDIQYLLKKIAVDDTRKEIRKKNEPTRLVVDNRETIFIFDAKRRIEVTFGNFLDKLLIKTIERELMSAIRSYAVSPEDAALGNMALWGWYYAPKSGIVATRADFKTLKALPVGSYLVLKPKSPMVGLANMFAARKAAGWPKGDWLGKKGRSGGAGFMRKGIDKIRRSRLMKNYTIRVAFTGKYPTPGEKAHPGGVTRTPVIVLRAARKRRGYRRIKI